MTVYWTQFAEDKLEDIFNYYKFKAGTRVAEKITDEIVDATLNLEKNPYLRTIEDLLSERIQNFRFSLFKSYKIIYWVEETNKIIFIANIFDTRQNPETLNLTP